jgi:hypothetical protein
MIATLESTLPEVSNTRLPPSARDLDVYEHVAVKCRTTRDAAREFGISQTRVRQVLSRVAEFLMHALPTEEVDDKPSAAQKKLAGAQSVARMQLDYLYAEALTMWRLSMTPTAASPVPLGKVCYLNQAMRIVVAGAKVPLWAVPVGEEGDEDAEPASADARPPVRDCSENEASREADASQELPACSATSEPTETYRSLDEIKADAQRNFLRPAQAASAEPMALPESGEADGAIPAGLSRRQRRKIRRQRARASARP